MQFYCIPTCSTCAAARKWLQEHGIEFEEINLKVQPLAAEELIRVMKQSELPIKRFFNTSGTLYKEQGLKEVVPHLSMEEAAEKLASEGMLIKRPLAIHDNQLTIGFKAEVYEQIWQKEKETIQHGN